MKPAPRGRLLVWISLILIGYNLILYSDFFFPWGAPAGGDIISLHLPFLTSLQRQMFEGNPFPMWWREILCGVPAIPDLSPTLLNPFYILLYILSPLAVIKLQVLLCLFASGWGLLLFCRSFQSEEDKLSPQTSTLFLMTFSGLMIFRGLLSFGHLGVFSAVALFIWSLVLIQKLLQKGSVSTLFTLGLVLGLGWLTGHPQFTVMTHELTFLWLALHLDSNWKKNGQLLAIYFGAVALGGIIGSPQLYATFLHISETGRAATLENQEFLSSGALNLLHIFRWLFPFSFGEAQSYWGQFTFYMGIPWGHGLWAIFLFLGLKGSGWRLKAFSLYILIMAFGYQAYLYAWHQELIPWAKLFRFPSRYLYMLIPFLMVFSYRGILRASTQNNPKWSTPILVTFSLVSILLYVFPVHKWNALPPHVLERASESGEVSSWVLALALIPIGILFCILKDKKVTGLLIFLLSSQCVISLFNSFSNVKLEGVPAQSSKESVSLLRNNHQSGWRNLGLLKGDLTIEGYSGLVPLPFRELVDTQLAQDFSKHNRLQFRGLPEPFLDEVGVQRDGGNPQPIIRFADTFHPIEFRRRSKFSKSIQFKQEQLEESFKEKYPDIDLQAPSAHTIKILEHQSDRWQIEVNNRRPGVFLFMENNHPLWKASIDGKSIPIHTWLGSFKAIFVPSGEHLIEFKIPKENFFYFLSASILSLFVCILFGTRNLITQS